MVLSYCGWFLNSSVILSVLSQDRDKTLIILLITCFVLNTYRARSSSTTSLKIVPWSGFKLSFVWDYCSCSESCTLVFDRDEHYSTAGLKLITSRLGSSLDTNRPC